MIANVMNPRLEAPKRNRPSRKDIVRSNNDFLEASLRRLIRAPICFTLSSEYPADLSNVRVSTGALRI
jgi:hypothetical protein